MSEREQRTTLDWEWVDWRCWAEDLIAISDPRAVADSIADLGVQVNDLRRGMAAEAIVVNAQVLSMNPRVVGKGRSKIVREQVRRMFRCALAQEPPRSLVRWGRSWSIGAAKELERFEAER